MVLDRVSAGTTAFLYRGIIERLLWTSGNRAFHCNNMTLFEWLLKHIDENFVSEDIPGDNSNLDIASLERCRKKILSVIWQELKEYGLKSEGEEC